MLKFLYYKIINIIFNIGVFSRKYNIDIYYPYSKIKQYKDIHKGKRCFIIGTGPSLNIQDLELLKDEYTFSMNSILLSFKDTKWRPTYYVIQDGRAYSIFKDKLLNQNIKDIFLGISYRRKSIFLNKFLNKNFNKYNYFPLKIFEKGIENKNFSDDCYKQIYDGATVTYSILQLALYMGFKEIYLLGIDCDYTTKGKKKNIIEYVKNTNTIETENDMINAYKLAHNYAIKNGIEIYNTSNSGKLKIFKYRNIKDIKDLYYKNLEVKK